MKIAYTIIIIAIIGAFTLLHLFTKLFTHLIEIADVKYQAEKYKYKVIRKINTLELPKQDVSPFFALFKKEKMSEEEKTWIGIEFPNSNYGLPEPIKHDIVRAKVLLESVNGRLGARKMLTAKDVEILLNAIEHTKHYYLSTLVIDNDGKIHRVYFKDIESLENFVKNGWGKEDNNQSK